MRYVIGFHYVFCTMHVIRIENKSEQLLCATSTIFDNYCAKK